MARRFYRRCGLDCQQYLFIKAIEDCMVSIGSLQVVEQHNDYTIDVFTNGSDSASEAHCMTFLRGVLLSNSYITVVTS